METMIYKELARSTYNKIFTELDNYVLCFFSEEVDSLKKMILDRRNTLPDISTQILFMEELATIIKKERLTQKEEWVKIIGTDYIPNYDKIQTLYDWIREQSNSVITYNNYTVITNVPKSNVNEKNFGKPQQKFSDYLHHPNKDDLMKNLHELLDGKKGREVAKVLMALEQKSYIIIPTKGLEKVRRSMIAEFGYVGTQQSISRYYQKKDPKGNTIISQSEIQIIINILP